MFPELNYLTIQTVKSFEDIFNLESTWGMIETVTSTLASGRNNHRRGFSDIPTSTYNEQHGFPPIVPRVNGG
jgi:hypothetical protein